MNASRIAAWWVAAMLSFAAIAHAAAPLPWQVKLDPRLADPARITDIEPVSVWVEFVDKGETGPADLAARLAAAEAALTPKARARRERAKVTPMVDYLDLPLHPPYVAALAARGFQPYGASRWFNRVAVRVPGTRISEIASLDFVRAMAPVEKAALSRDPIGQGESIPRPTRVECPKGDCIGQPQVNYGMTAAELAIYNIAAMHDSGYVGTGITICMLDDGFQFYRRHEALKDISVPAGYTRDIVLGNPGFVDSTAAPEGGPQQHGGWTFACAGGNKPGIFLGAAYGATFALARTEVDSFERPVEMTNWDVGAEWADSLGADIISSSLGYTTFDTGFPSYTFADMNGHTTTITRAAEIAASKGILVVNAAGNEGSNSWGKVVAPADANGDSVLAVGAVDLAGVRTNFSSKGPTYDQRIKPDLMAMGSSNPLPNLGTPLNPTAYTHHNGTSFATPLLAGFAACLMQARPNFTPVQIIQAMRASADRFTIPDTLYGYGIPNGAKALQVSGSTTSVPPSSIHITLAGPNPFRAGQIANLRFAVGSGVPAGAKARVNVYDASGRRVRELWCADAIPTDMWIGVTWNGVRPGLYFVSLEVGHETQSARLVYLR